MYQIDNSSAATSQPASTAAGTAGFFTDGNPATATPATIVPAEWLNSVMMELINVVNAGGVTPTKNQFNNVLTALKNGFSPVVGSMRNLAMSVATAGTSATMTADEIVVGAALGGQKYVLSSFSKTINLAGTPGAGAMDTGSAPTNGYVALYAIYNPTTATAALLAKNATSAIQPNVYGGANMPPGYTASALVSVWPTNGSGQFLVGNQSDRVISTLGVTVLTTTTPQTTYTSFTVGVPPNAKTCRGYMAISGNTSGAGLSSSLAGSSSGIGSVGQGGTIPTNSASVTNSFPHIPLITPQTLYYQANVSAGTMTFIVGIYEYTF